MLKGLERLAKWVLAALAALLLGRPWRRARALAALSAPARLLVVRIDDRVGEALLTTPLLTALRALPWRPQVDVLVHARVARVLEGLPDADAVIAFDRRHLWLGPLAPGIRALRRAGYPVVINCTNWTAPSVTGALVSRLVGPGAAVLGPAGAPTSWLQTVSTPPRPDTRSEVLQRVHLASPLAGLAPREALSFRRPRPSPAVAELLPRLGAFAVVNPGGRLGFRRISPSAFAAVARALRALGRTPLVTWGPGEEAMAREVVQAAPGAVLAPPTDLDALAALMAAAGCTVCNNTGPMHLSVAVGAPTLGLFLRMEMARWGHARPPHRMVDLTPVADAGGDVDAAAAEAARAFALGLAAPEAAGR